MISLQRRREPRKIEHIPLIAQGIDQRSTFFVEIVFTENTSFSGACIELSNEVSIGQKLKIFFRVGQLENLAIASVRWVEKKDRRWRVGIKFEPSCETS